MSVETHAANGNGTSTNRNGNGQQPDVWAYVMAVLSRKRLILGMGLLFGAVGVLLSLIPREPAYTASAIVIREAIVQQNAFQVGSILSFGQTPIGLTSEVYPSIIQSREVRLAVIRDTFFLSDPDTSMTFAAYVQRQENEKSWFEKTEEVVTKYTINLPVTLKRMANQSDLAKRAMAIRAAQQRDSLTAAQTGTAPTRPMPQEEMAIGRVYELLTIVVDPVTGLMTLSVTTEDAMLSAGLVDSFIRHFQTRVHDLLTVKTRQNLEFTQQRFNRVTTELRAAERELASFNDRNINPQSPYLLTERERLTRAVLFKQQLYTQLQSELAQAEVELQRSRPVLTVVQEPVVPLGSSASGPNYPLIGLVLGLLLGVAVALYPLGRDWVMQDEAMRQRMEQMKNSFRLKQKSKTPALAEHNV